MDSNTIAIVSSRSRGISQDLKLVMAHLAKTMDSVSYRVFTRNENAKNRFLAMGNKAAKKTFCKDVGHAICIDGSLPAKLAATARTGKKVLIPTPYMYQFDAMNKLAAQQKPAKRKTFKPYTHILTGSPFCKELLTSCYQLSKNTEQIDVCTPLAWAICQPTQQEKVRAQFTNYFPESAGKKILSILLTGLTEEDENNPLGTFDWKAFLDNLPSDWFVFVNNEDAIEHATPSFAAYRDRFGYVNRMLDARELLSISDCLITNSGVYASTFAARRKPIYGTAYRNNAFEMYMKRCYPALFLKSFDGVLDKLETYDANMQAFCEQFSYPPDKNPCIKIQNIFSE